MLIYSRRCSLVYLFEAWLMHFWWFKALSASLESAEKEEVVAQHGEELLSKVIGYL